MARATIRVFAYGTLITGALSPEIDRLVAAHCIDRREGVVRGRLLDLGSYPGLVPAATRSERVLGQVLTLTHPDRCLPVFDAYEGYDPRAPHRSLYRRESTRVRLETGGHTAAWTYWLNQRPVAAERIPGGDYRGYLGQV